MEDRTIMAIKKSVMIAAPHDERKFSELFMAFLLTRDNRIEKAL
jgi:CRP/FNR family cyclic AMP-dependent transcriptional regulator